MMLQWLITISLLAQAHSQGRQIAVMNNYLGEPSCLIETPGVDFPAQECLKTHDIVEMGAGTEESFVYPQCDKARASPSCGRQFRAAMDEQLTINCTIHSAIPANKQVVIYGVSNYEFFSFDETITAPMSFEVELYSTSAIVAVERLKRQKTNVLVSCAVASAPYPPPSGGIIVEIPPPDYCLCGTTHPVTEMPHSSLTLTRGMSPRIQGGSVTELAAHPYAVGLKATRDQMVVDAMGVLISTQFVMTTTSALEAVLAVSGATLPYVAVGMYNIRYTAAHETVIALSINKFEDDTTAPTGNPYLTDVALIQISDTGNYQNVIPACLSIPTTDYVAAGGSGTIVGWGLNKPTDKKARSRRRLHEMSLPIVASADCTAAYPDIAGLTNDNSVCTSVTDEMVGFCQGDMGAPLLVPSSTGSIELVGLAMHGEACRPEGDNEVKPNVFIRLTAAIITWAQTTMENDGVCPPATA